jgi:DNA-binding response OmpR family regulator
MNRLLHVEDEPDIREVALVALRDVGGFEVEAASSGREALEKAPGFRPDVILLDVMMPGMDGPETLRELRKKPETARVPVIFMTAKVQSHEVVAYRKLGALDVIAKPFDPMELAGMVREILRNGGAPSSEHGSGIWIAAL